MKGVKNKISASVPKQGLRCYEKKIESIVNIRNYNIIVKIMFTRRYMYNVIDLHAKMHVWISSCNKKIEQKKIFMKRRHEKYTIRTCRDDNILNYGPYALYEEIDVGCFSLSFGMVVKLNWNSSHKFCTNLCRTKRYILWSDEINFFSLMWMATIFLHFPSKKKKIEWRQEEKL